MGRRRRRRKIVVRRRRRLPSMFQCPNCGYMSVTVTINKKDKEAIVKCSSCGLSHKLPLSPYLDPVDYYGKFLDWYEEQVSVT